MHYGIAAGAPVCRSLRFCPKSGAFMKLSDEEQAMAAGEMGAPKRWATEHMMQVGRT